MRTWAGALCAITLFTTAATSASASEYMVDEAGKFGPKGAMVMSRQSLGTETVDGVPVVRMKDVITGKITGTDMYGNQYGVDEKGKLGSAGAFRKLFEHLDTELVDGVPVTRLKDLRTGTVTGTDMYGNQYGVDEKAKLGKAGAFRMLGEQVGSEKVDGVTVTKMKSLLDGSITGSDAYGDAYVAKGGKLTLVK